MPQEYTWIEEAGEFARDKFKILLYGEMLRGKTIHSSRTHLIQTEHTFKSWISDGWISKYKPIPFLKPYKRRIISHIRTVSLSGGIRCRNNKSKFILNIMDGAQSLYG